MTHRALLLLALATPLVLGFSSATAAADSAIEVRVEGAVRSAGVVRLQPEGRIADALLAAAPRHDAYLLGGSLLNAHARLEQVRLRAGLLHTAGQLAKHSDLSLRDSGLALQQWLEAHPATGRTPLVFDARLLQVQPRHNPLAAAGDVLLLPVQPQTVHVLGAVAHACELPHAPLRDATYYVHQCAITAAADRNDIFVVQPDGAVQRLGVAAWNRADAQAVAPGGTVYVPLRQPALAPLDPTFNEDFASFIATQPIQP